MRRTLNILDRYEESGYWRVSLTPAMRGKNLRSHGALRLVLFFLALTILVLPSLSRPPEALAGTDDGKGATAAGSAGGGSPGPLLTTPLVSAPAPLSQFQRLTITGNFAASGTGMRNVGSGTISISGIPTDATILNAHLYWTILNPTTPSAAGTFEDNSITGTLLGTGIDPCWDGLQTDPETEGPVLVNSAASWTFRADVTSLLASPGNGSYALSGFPSGDTDGHDPFTSDSNLPLLEGASLVIVYFSPSEPQRDIVVYDGNAPTPDGSGNNPITLDLSGFQVSPIGAPSARFTFIGADGQTSAGDDNHFNGTILTALGSDPWDGSDNCCEYSSSDLWDTDIYDVSALVDPGDTTAIAAVESQSDCLVWTTAILAVNSTDVQPPDCESAVVGTGSSAVVEGSATDTQPGDSGIVSVELDPSSTNIVCTGCTEEPFGRGVPAVDFTLSLASGATSGSGSVIVTDDSGKTCRVGASYTGVNQGQVTDQPLFIDRTQGIKLIVLDGTATASDTALVGSSPPGPDDEDCLPACFEFPARSLVLTVESPVDGVTRTAYDIDIAPDSNLRLLFRHPTEACPLRDITESVQNLAFDPRLGGKPTWSRVQFVAGRVIPGCPPPPVATDVDGDGYSFGGATPPADADCDDANPGINPAATESCNGMDDDCDGAVDETGCGTVRLSAFLHKVGSGGFPKSTRGPLVGAEVRLYDAGPGSCADAVGATPRNYRTIYGEGTFADPGCAAVTSGLTDSQGMISFVVAPGRYIAIARPAPPHDNSRIGVMVGDVFEGEIVNKRMQLIVTADGSEVPARTIVKTGSELLIIEPELVVWDSAIEAYPIVLESDSLWNTTTTIEPPPGFVADATTLSTMVDGGSAVIQFTLYDTATEFTPVALRHDVSHGKVRHNFMTHVETLKAPSGEADRVAIARCEASPVSRRRTPGGKLFTLEVAATSDRAGGVRLAALDATDPASPRLLGRLSWDPAAGAHVGDFRVKDEPASILIVSSGWGRAACTPAAP